MSNYNNLITTQLNAKIKANGNQEITGPVLNGVLAAMVSALGEGYQYKGVATTATNPGTTDARVFYIAPTAGTYTNFGIVLTKASILYYDTAWHYAELGLVNEADLADAIAVVDAAVVHKAGAETISGAKTFGSDIIAAFSHIKDSSASNKTLADYLTEKAPQSTTYTKTEVDALLEEKADEEDLELKADKNGIYPQLYAGNLIDTDGSGNNEVILPLRTAGGEKSLTPLSSAEIKSLTAKTLVWNQQNNGDTTQSVSGGITSTYQGNGIWSLSGQCTALVFTVGDNRIKLINGHKSLVYCDVIECPDSLNGHTIYFGCFNGNTVGIGIANGKGSGAKLVTEIQNANSSIGFNGNYGGFSVEQDFTGTKVRFMYFDLTQMFGEGNEPSTVDEFKAMFPLPYYSYNAGTLLPFAATGLKTIGKNCWDEEWEVSTDHIVSKNYCGVIGGTDYYLKSPSALTFTWYNADKEQIGTSSASANAVVSTPTNCAFFKFACPTSYGTLYNNDISIFLKYNDSTLTYSPYEAHTLSLSITTMKGKLNGAGASVVIFPNGMHGAGTAGDCFTDLRADGKFHKARKVMGGVDLGSLPWSYISADSYFKAPLRNTFSLYNIICSKYQTHGMSKDKSIALANNSFVVVKDTSYTDVATFKAAMNGVYAYYSIATPEEYLLDEPIDASFFVNDGGTEQLLPANGVAPTTAPMYAAIKYSVNAIREVANSRKNLQSQSSMDALLTALGTALSFTWSKTWDATNEKWNYTITAQG